MANIEQAALVLSLANALRMRGSWAGETHVQKAGYVLQGLMNVPLEVSFILYKHGPYSFDLHARLNEMEADQFIQWEPRAYPYGPTMMPGRAADLLLRISRTPESYRKQIDFVSERLAGKRVADLERLATALYVTQKADTTGEQRADRIHELKPHVSMPDAIAAVAEIDQLRSEAEDKGLILKNHAFTA